MIRATSESDNEAKRNPESEALFKGLVENQAELVSLSTPEGVLTFVNHAYARWHGRQPHEMVGKSLFDFIPAKERAAVSEHLQMVCKLKRSVEIENQVVLPNGQTRTVSWINRAITDASGRVTAVHSVGRDVEWRVLAERRVAESEARYRLLAENSTDMVVQLDLNLVRRYVSPACREIFGYEPEELMGDKSGEMAHPEDAERVTQVLDSLRNGSADRQSVIARRRHRDGRWIWVEVQYRAVKDPVTGALTGIVGATRDISVRKAVEEQLADAYRRLETLAGQDGLTGLANRRAFDDALAREYRRARRDEKSLALVMIDVDRFKSFNDRHGHLAGDKCLRRISEAIMSTIGRSGDTAARYGGEEFVALLPDADELGAAKVGERIRQAVQALAIAHDASHSQVVTISAGVASIGPSAYEPGPEALVRDADQALYRAKEAGQIASSALQFRLEADRKIAPPPVAEISRTIYRYPSRDRGGGRRFSLSASRVRRPLFRQELA